jgi:hypothetical protein
MRSHRALSLAASAVVLLLLLSAWPAVCQTEADFIAVKGMDEKFRLDLGGFFQQFTTTIRLDSSTLGRGTEINLEDDLGVKANQTNFRADGYWRIGRHSRLDFGYTGWNRSNSRSLDRDIQVGDTVYHAGANVDTTLRCSLAELYYGYSFWNTPKFEAGLQLGVSAVITSVRLEGSGTVSGGGGSGTRSFSSEGRSTTAPIPAIGVQLRYTIVPGLLVSGKVRGMTVTIDNTKASVLEARGSLDYYPWKNVGFGAAYDYMDIQVTKQAEPVLEVEYRYSGPMVYLSLVF